MRFIKCNNSFTNKDYTEEIQDFNRKKIYHSDLNSSAKMQAFCKKYDVHIGCFDGTRKYPRNITQRNISLYI